MPEASDALDLRTLEQEFAYLFCSTVIEGACLALSPPGSLVVWHDLSTAGDMDLSEEVAYLASRGLLGRHPDNAEWIHIRDEGAPLREPEAA